MTAREEEEEEEQEEEEKEKSVATTYTRHDRLFPSRNFDVKVYIHDVVNARVYNGGILYRRE
ncbi:MAG: hypothetical protein IT281_09795 [Ignavibacteria bacterium]|nr:hypothetical protein [Ignavibacteria bacterium]